MKNHSQFMGEIKSAFPNTDQTLLTKVGAMSAEGVAPEGYGSDEKNKIVDALYRLDPSSYGSIPEVPKAAPTPSRPCFILGTRSKERLKTLLPHLRQVVERAITLTQTDFTVLETDRTLAKQKEYLAAGTTRTLKSKHLIQPDGFAHAVDLAAWINGKVSWHFDHYFRIVQAMDEAATQLAVADHVRWGAVWDRVLSDFGGITSEDYIRAVDEYKARHPGPDFLDGPHFEWVA